MAEAFGAGNIGGLSVPIQVDISAFSRSLTQAHGTFQGHANAMISSADMVGRSIGLSLASGMAAATTAIIKFGSGFEKAMQSSVAIMTDLSDSMRREMEQSAIDVSRTTTFSAEEAAKAYYYLASAGFDAAQSLEAIAPVSRFAQAGMFDMAQATEYLADAQAALGMRSQEAHQNMMNMVRLSDVMVKANTLANASVEEFAVALTHRAGAALRLVNKEVEEGVAVLAALASQGTKGALAGDRLAIALRDLQRTAIKNKDVFRKAGVSVFDEAGNMRNVADIIEDLTNLLGPMSDEMMRASLMILGFQDRSIVAITSLIGLADQIRYYEEQLRQAGGTTDEVANKQLKNFQDQLNLVTDTIRASAIYAYQALTGVLEDSLMPALMGGAEFLADFALGLKNTNPELITLIAVIGATMVAVGGLSLAVRTATWVFTGWGLVSSGLVVGLGALIAILGSAYILFDAFNNLLPREQRELKALADAFMEVTGNISFLMLTVGGTMMAVVGGPVAAFIFEVGLVVTLIISLIKVIENADTIMAGWESTWKSLSDTWHSALSYINRVTGAALKYIAEGFKWLADSIRQYMGEAGTYLGEWADTVVDLFASTFDSLSNMFNKSSKKRLDAAKKEGRSIGEAMVPKKMSLWDQWIWGMSEGLDTVLDLFRGIGFEGEKLNDETFGDTAVGIDAIKDKIKELKKNFDFEAEGMISPEWQEELDKFFTKGSESLAGLAEKAEALRLKLFPEEAMAEAVKEVQELANLFPGLIDDEAVGRALANIVKEFAEDGVGPLIDIDDKLKGISQSTKDAFDAAQLAEYNRQLDEMVSKLEEEAFQEELERIKEMQRLLGTAREEAFPAQSFMESIMQMQTAMLSLEGSIDEEVMKFFMGEQWDRFSGMGIEAVENLIPEFEKLDEATRRILENLIDEEKHEQFNDNLRDISEEMANIGAEFSQVGRNIDSDLVSKVGALIHSAHRAMNAVTKLKEAFSKMGEDGESNVKKVSNLIKAGATGNMLELVAATLEAAEVFGLFGDKGEKELSRVDEFFNDLGDTIDGFADDAADAIADFVETGKLDFKDMVDSMLRDLLRLGIQYSITDPLFGAIRGAFSAKGNVFGSSGDVVPFAKGGVVTVPTMFPISNRKVGIMGEGMKEEAILPLERGANGRLGVSAYGMGNDVSIVVNDMRSAGDPDINISESASATGGRQISINIAKAVKDEMARGFFDDVLGYSLGVRRRGGAY